MNTSVIMVMGFPASGKSTITAPLAAQGSVVLNRDTEGGSMGGLLEKFKERIAAGVPRIVLDNTFCTVEDRAPFIQAAKEVGASIVCAWMLTSAEDALINALHRMWDRYGMVFLTAADIKAHPVACKDPNMFPAAAIFSYRKRFEKPTLSEGFDAIQSIGFQRRPFIGTRKAIILDYDGTLRADASLQGGKHPYPTDISQVQALPRRGAVLQSYKDQGFLLLGVSNQSGIAKGHLTSTQARACFDETNRQLGVGNIDTMFCEHGSFPVACYCRKPQSGLGVHLIRKYDLDPPQCIFVGDMSTDRSFAARLGFQFAEAEEFFKPL